MVLGDRGSQNILGRNMFCGIYSKSEINIFLICKSSRNKRTVSIAVREVYWFCNLTVSVSGY